MKRNKPLPHRTPQEAYEDFLARFRTSTDQELIDAFNREVGNPGWTSSRASYLAALHEELRSRSFDFSAVGDERSLSLRSKIRLVGKIIEPLDASKVGGAMIRVGNLGVEPRKRAEGDAAERDLVYGDALGGLVFLRRQRAQDLAKMYEARRTLNTWGEFKRAISPRLLDEIGTADDVGDPIPDGAPLHEHDPVSEMWPFPNSEQLEILPDDVIALGEVSDTGEGDRLDLPTSAEGEILERLHAHGYCVERNDALVSAAVDP